MKCIHDSVVSEWIDDMDFEVQLIAGVKAVVRNPFDKQDLTNVDFMIEFSVLHCIILRRLIVTVYIILDQKQS